MTSVDQELPMFSNKRFILEEFFMAMTHPILPWPTG